MQRQRWVRLTQLAAEVGFSTKALQQIRATEPGVLVSRDHAKRGAEYKQPDCAINLRLRERRKAEARAAPKSSREAEQRKAMAEAQLAEEKLRRLQGLAVPVEDVRREYEGLVLRIRTAIEAHPRTREFADEILAALHATAPEPDAGDGDPEEEAAAA